MPVPEDAVHEVCGRAVECDNLDRATEEALQRRLDLELRCVQRRGRLPGEENAYVDVAGRARVAAGHASEEIYRDGSPGVLLEEGLEAGFDGRGIPGFIIGTAALERTGLRTPRRIAGRGSSG